MKPEHPLNFGETKLLCAISGASHSASRVFAGSRIKAHGLNVFRLSSLAVYLCCHHPGLVYWTLSLPALLWLTHTLQSESRNNTVPQLFYHEIPRQFAKEISIVTARCWMLSVKHSRYRSQYARDAGAEISPNVQADVSSAFAHCWVGKRGSLSSVRIKANTVTRSSSGQRHPRVRSGAITLWDVLLLALLP